MKHPFLALIAGCILDLALTSTAIILDDVPGCACQADKVCEKGSEGRKVMACAFTQKRRYPYKFENVHDESPVPICDALEADAEFQEAVGNQSVTYDIFYSGNNFGQKYFKTGPISYRIAPGMCDDLYAQESSCPTIEPPFITKGISYPQPGQSTMVGLTLPNTKSFVQFANTCKSNIDDDDNTITFGYEDDLLLYVTLEPGVDNDDDYVDSTNDLSIVDVMSSYQPVLTSKDWIEPIAASNRRYMSHEFVDVNGREYCLLVMSLGNEPCKGPAPLSLPNPSPSSSANDFSSSSSVNGNPNYAVILHIMGYFAFAVFFSIL